MDYFDLHCDTPFDLYHKNASLSSGDTHITCEKLSGIRKYAQVMDIWSKHGMPCEEQWCDFEKIREYLQGELAKNQEFAFCTSDNQLSKAEDENKRAVFLGVEGAGLLSGKIERLDILYSVGVRVLTPVWKDADDIGGAYNTETGLTEFGKSVVLRATELGIIVDVSHASERMTDEITELCRNSALPAIATHSNSRAVFMHRRNLTDDAAKKLASAGGIIGVSFAKSHLAISANANDIIHHIGHYLDMGLDKNICIGADMDGASLPNGICDISSVPSLYEKAENEFGEETAKRIFYKNAREYFKRLIK